MSEYERKSCHKDLNLYYICLTDSCHEYPVGSTNHLLVT